MLCGTDTVHLVQSFLNDRHMFYFQFCPKTVFYIYRGHLPRVFVFPKGNFFLIFVKGDTEVEGKFHKLF